jgi:chaperonin GroEL
VIIADDVDGEALTTFVLNKLAARLMCSQSKRPGYGDRKNEMLEDIAVMTGGEVITEKTASKFENTTLEHAWPRGKKLSLPKTQR